MRNVLIVDDHEIVRLGTILILKQITKELVVTEASDFHEAVRILRVQPFDLVVLDVNIAGGDNLQMIDTIRLRQPQVKILVLSGYEEHIYGPRFIEAGADGYVSKHSAHSEIKLALQKVLNQEKYVSPAVKEIMGQESKPLLSMRETEVMQLLIKGRSIAEIASQLHIQVSTASTYKLRIMEKLQVSNVIELAEKARLIGHK